RRTAGGTSHPTRHDRAHRPSRGRTDRKLSAAGNNTTGISNMIQDMSAKGLELIREVAPTAKTVAALFNPNNPGSRLMLEDVRSQAAKLGMTIQPIEFKGSAVLDATLEAAAGRDALLVVADSTLFVNASPGWHYDIDCRHCA